MNDSCEIRDLLRQRIIPPLSWDNSAIEAVCRLPERLPHMAVFDIKKEYGFTNEEFLMKLDPEYVSFVIEGHEPPPDNCAEKTNTALEEFVWVSYIKDVSAHQNTRRWIVGYPEWSELLCNTDSGIKPPGIPMFSTADYLPKLFTTFANEMDKSLEPGGGNNRDMVEDAYRQAQGAVDDFRGAVQGMLNNGSGQKHNFNAQCGLYTEEDCVELCMGYNIVNRDEHPWTYTKGTRCYNVKASDKEHNPKCRDFDKTYCFGAEWCDVYIGIEKQGLFESESDFITIKYPDPEKDSNGKEIPHRPCYAIIYTDWEKLKDKLGDKYGYVHLDGNSMSVVEPCFFKSDTGECWETATCEEAKNGDSEEGGGGVL